MDIQENISLAQYSTMKTGGPARFFVEVSTIEDLEKAISFANVEKVPIIILGGGSNVLFPDEGINGLVIKNNILGMSQISENETHVIFEVGAGEDWDNLVQKTLGMGLCGLENLSYIPGTVGASPVQNIGAYGVEVKEYIKEVFYFDLKEGRHHTIKNTDCAFSYRDSIFKKNKHWIITSVTFSLSKEFSTNISYKDLEVYFQDQKPSTAQDVRNAVIDIRKNKLPDWKEIGTVGSFFKNPIISKKKYNELLAIYLELPMYEVDEDNVKVPLAWILDKVLDLKGYRQGNIGLYEKQPLAIVNYGEATTSEVLDFAEKIFQKVFESTGIQIEREVRVI